MALREFKDSRGTEWLAWDVPPARIYSPPRSGEDRRRNPSAEHHPERRVIRDRRRENAAQGLQNGWVCFQSPEEKRRLAPPPTDWETAADEALEALLGRAQPITRRGAE